MSSNKAGWEIFWEIPDCPPFLTAEPARMFTRGLRPYAGANFSDCILEYRNNNNIWYLDGKEWSRLDQVLFERILKNSRWGDRINTLAADYCYPCLKFLDDLQNIELSGLSDAALYRVYQKFTKVYFPAHGSGHPANVLEMKNQRLSEYLRGYLQKRAWNTDTKVTGSEAFSLLVAPVKDMSPQQEAKSFYRLAVMIARQAKLAKYFKTHDARELAAYLPGNYPREWRAIQQHAQDWCWTVYNYEGPANTLEYYLDSLASALRQPGSAKRGMKKLLGESKALHQEQNSLLKKLRVDNKHRHLLRIASDIIFFKALRKDCIYKGAWASTPLYQEIARRLKISVHESRYIFYFEMSDALLQKRFSSKALRERAREVVLHLRAGKPDVILTGPRAKKFISSLRVKKPDTDVKELRGQCAYAGKIRGRVRLINTPAMIGKMKKGDILMAYATQPNLLPAMLQASAFITDFGGITCHAAIVAREWKVPCVIGTGNATKILRDGELVEIDAAKGLVTRLEKIKK